MGKGNGKGSAFGNLSKKMEGVTLDSTSTKAKEAKVEKSEGAAGANDTPAGWSWSALAAMEGVNNINSNLYGEVLPDGCALMFKSLPPQARLEQDSVVYDLGSGYGKFSIWVGTVAKHRSIGIEYNSKRAAWAEKALSECYAKNLLGEEDKKRIELREGDAFLPGAFADATHMYVCNVGMDEDMHDKLLQRIPECKNFRALLTITSLHEGERAVPAEDLKKAGLTFDGKVKCPVTWDFAGDCTYTNIYLTELGMKKRDPEPENLKLKLADAERFSAIVNDVFDGIMKEIPPDEI